MPTRQSSFIRMLLITFIVIGGMSQVKAQNDPQPIMNTLKVAVEHESGQDIHVKVEQAGETEVFVFTLEQANDAEYVDEQLMGLEPNVLEAVKGALIRINRSEILTSSDKVKDGEVQWVDELCNDINADCEVLTETRIIKKVKKAEPVQTR